jgi:hypothetical protein
MWLSRLIDALPDSTEVAYMTTEYRTPSKRARALYSQDVHAANTGIQVLSLEQWRERRRSAAELEAEGRALERLLEQSGRVLRNPTPITAIGLVTGLMAPIVNLRACSFHPVVAVRERQRHAAALRYLGERSERPLRFAVLTSGQPVPLDGDLRSRIGQFHRAISKLAHEARRRFGIEFLMRVTEWTYATGRGAHPHANVVYRAGRRMTAADWTAFHELVRRRMGNTHHHDAGEIENLGEAIGYILKSPPIGDLLSCPDAVRAAAWLFESTTRLHMAQPMGALSAEVRDRKDHGEKLVHLYERDANGRVTRPKLCIVETNSGIDTTGTAEEGSVETNPGIDAPCVDEGKSRNSNSRSRGAENLVICKTLPQAKFSHFLEPVALVMNYTPTPYTVDGKAGLQIIEEWKKHALTHWKRNGAPPPEDVVAMVKGHSVHMSRITVPSGSDNDDSLPSSEDGEKAFVIPATEDSMESMNAMDLVDDPDNDFWAHLEAAPSVDDPDEEIPW